jgi:C-terminal processing protease CtpA/Prc
MTFRLNFLASKCIVLQLAAGDALVSVDNAPVGCLDYRDIVRRVRGPAGTRVVLGFRRPIPATATGPGSVRLVALERRRTRAVPQCAFGGGVHGMQSGYGRTFVVL